MPFPPEGSGTPGGTSRTSEAHGTSVRKTALGPEIIPDLPHFLFPISRTSTPGPYAKAPAYLCGSSCSRSVSEVARSIDGKLTDLSNNRDYNQPVARVNANRPARLP